jgi:DNA-binding response OmpR family regulator
MSVKPDSKLILVVDDEATVRDVLRRYLEREGFHVAEAAYGDDALNIVEHDTPDLILLDLMIPGMDGMEVTRQVRKKFRTPIIMLTAKGETEDRIRGLNLGADDYVVKPFSPQEVVSRVFAVLRRVDEKTVPTGEPLEIGRFKLDPNTRSLYIEGKMQEHTAKEFDLLWLFASHPDRVFTRNQLLEHVWGPDYFGDPTTITVHMRRLREKIEKDPSNPTHLITVWGVGYKFEA